ncbi:hypothetical protein PHYPSEUDO_009710 [Phytophthora pseudosyringae]|uniref:Uncharacterized protein n=1 Tax=Phytophthora pseudosyringae TaxID=221518 RepID=A0A8T1WC75_9STRA|nr:hypothetical protein PHYPSEUDO_009710 [Phytophthora pseudosyringae]
MDADRELFVQQLVAALQEEDTTLSGGASLLSSPLPSSADSADGGSSPDSAAEGEKSPQEYTGLFLTGTFSTPGGGNDRLARDAYMQLQFDFPQAQEASIEALAELYRRVSAEKSTHHVAAEVPVTVALLEGVAFLNDQGPSSGSAGAQRSRSSEGSGLLAAALLLLVFRACLESPEDARVEALLSSLAVKASQQEQTINDTNDSVVGPEQDKEEHERDEFVEKFAAQEDPDDLSEVYEGHLPEPREHCIPMWNRRTSAVSTASRAGKLRYLASHTYSSSFETVSMEKWEQWHLDDELVAIMRLLVDRPPEDTNALQDTEEVKLNSAQIALYGPRGEWSRYLYVLRDRVLRFPGTSRNSLWRLKELIEFLQRHQTVATAAKSSGRRVQQPQHLVYRVLAELAILREFHQGAAQRGQQGLALAIQELLPLIASEIHQLVSVPSATTTHQTKISTPECKNDSLEAAAADDDGDDGGDDELAVVFVQLLHFMLFASPNARTTTEKLHESGMLRTLLMLLPPTPAIDIDLDPQAQYLEKRWFPALIRLLGECALWHAGFAAYITRVPKFVRLLPTLREQLVAEELLLALAFHQHEVQARTPEGAVAPANIWEVFVSDSLFPQRCTSFLEAMKKLQDTVFILGCLEKVLPALRPAMQKELQRSLQQIYGCFARSFEYPTFAAAEAARQQQQFEQQALSDDATKGDDQEKEKAKEKKEEDRGQAEALQFTALRNKLRQSVKSLLAALSSGSAMARVGGRASSKLD